MVLALYQQLVDVLSMKVERAFTKDNYIVANEFRKKTLCTIHVSHARTTKMTKQAKFRW